MSINALTTVFTPPVSCLNNVYSSIAPSVYGKEVPVLISSECYPSGFSPWSASAYSPGVCPSGYSQGPSNRTGSSTTAFCCPSGMSAVDTQCWQAVMTPTNLALPDATIAVTTAMLLQPAINIAWASSDLPHLAMITSSPSSLSSTMASSTSTAAPPAEVVHDLHGLSVALEIGITVGVAVAAFGLSGIAIWFILAKRRKTARAARGPEKGFQELEDE